MNPIPSLLPIRGLIGKAIDKVHDTGLPAPWPATCVECDHISTDRAHAERHRRQSEHTDVVVRETDRDLQLNALREAVSERGAECGVRGVHLYDDRSVN